MTASWKPHEKHGKLSAQSDLPDSVFAFPKERKEPLTDANHVRNAIARFDQVTGVSDAERARAFANIEKAAKYYGVKLSETSWHDLVPRPQGGLKKRAKRPHEKAGGVKATRKRKAARKRRKA